MARETQHEHLPDIALDQSSGVPYYRQVIDQILYAIAAERLRPGDRLPTVRQLAVDLAINPNTVGKAYNELLIREVLVSQQGTGTFVAKKTIEISEVQRRQKLSEIVHGLVAKASSYGLTVQDVIDALSHMQEEDGS